jgi:polyphosphate:AMP phosphotransferase
MYSEFHSTSEHIIMRTSTGEAPWTIVEGEDHRYRSLRVCEVLLDEIKRKLPNGTQDGPSAAENAASADSAAPLTVLSTLDMDLALDDREYKTRLKELQARRNRLHREARARGISSIMVFEGWDAAGKGGAIRRMVAAIDARDYQVIPISAPTDEERVHHYLWRFWRHLSRAGRVTVFDRSWYGRVLVERVEGFASEDEWRRAYSEINDFEQQLVDYGIVLSKFWIHITREEQEARFQARAEVPYKRWKLTDEDWRNRESWNQYEIAVNDMIERTSTITAPWHLVEGNDKKFARIKVLQTVCDQLEQRLAADDEETQSQQWETSE